MSKREKEREYPSKIMQDMINRGGSGSGEMRDRRERRPKDKKNDPINNE